MMKRTPIIEDEDGNAYFFMEDVTPESILEAYRIGFFPMANTREEEDFFWIRPIKRGVFTFDAFHVPSSVIKQFKKTDWSVRINTNFAAIIHHCATIRTETWINHTIEALYTQLHHQGHAHSVEIWNSQDQLIGGLYGLSLGRAFFGESMFSTQSGASKLALAGLMTHLKSREFAFCDTQFVNDHLTQFGIQEWHADTYALHLQGALSTGTSPSFSSADNCDGTTVSLSDICAFSGATQSITQTS